MVRITGGRVYDPANGVEGVIKDICIDDDGHIVADANGSASRTIDAAGMVIFPGGVDVHTHVAGGALNFARGLVPENQRVARKFMHSPELRTGIGGMTPTTFATGYLYAGMGWTTVNEAAVPILSAKHTHEEMHDIPIVDKSTLLLMANNEMMLDLLEAGEYERAKSLVGWMLWSAKTYGIKAVNPGRCRGVEVGEERQPPSRAHRRLQEHHGGADHRAARADRRRSRVAASDAPASEQPRRSRQRHLDDRNDEGIAGASRASRAPAVPCLRRT